MTNTRPNIIQSTDATILSQEVGLLSFFADDSTRQKIDHHINFNGLELFCKVRAIEDYGLPTVGDSDVIHYIGGLLLQRMAEPDFDPEDPKSRQFVFSAADFFRATKRTLGAKNYEYLERAFLRLRTSSIATNLSSDEKEVLDIYNWLTEGSYAVKERHETGDRRISKVRVTLSEWAYGLLTKDRDLLTQIPEDFYSLPLVYRRLFHVLLSRLRDPSDAIIAGMPEVFDWIGSPESRARDSRLMARVRDVAEQSIPENYKKGFVMEMPLFQVALFDSVEEAEQAAQDGVLSGVYTTKKQSKSIVGLFTRKDRLQPKQIAS